MGRSTRTASSSPYRAHSRRSFRVSGYVRDNTLVWGSMHLRELHASYRQVFVSELCRGSSQEFVTQTVFPIPPAVIGTFPACFEVV